jgi:catechol 2,3-dioxygenase-like lactoylglutathione lyase family enzyme
MDAGDAGAACCLSRQQPQEVPMSSSETMHEPASPRLAVATSDLKLEVVVLPVADVEKAKRFYTGLGWRVDADFASGDTWRLVQLTPPGSPCSVMIGKGFTNAVPGSVQGTVLVVDDVDRARAELTGRGAAVSEVFHFENDLLAVHTNGRLPGPDPERRSYFSFAAFADPDGNGWLVQEVKTRFPGRGLGVDVGTLTTLLREAEERHGAYEATAPAHHWSAWYAAYLVARQQGSEPEAAEVTAARHMTPSRG